MGQKTWHRRRDDLPVGSPGANVMFAVKTSSTNFRSRLLPLLQTVYKAARESFVVVTDRSNPAAHFELKDFLSNGAIVDDACGGSHSSSDLCCKTGAALELALLG